MCYTIVGDAHTVALPNGSGGLVHRDIKLADIGLGGAKPDVDVWSMTASLTEAL